MKPALVAGFCFFKLVGEQKGERFFLVFDDQGQTGQ
jgi:hypothetical protein